METPASHIELWTALATVAGAAGVALLRMGMAWAQVLTQLREVRQNQYVLATKVGVELPYPSTEK